MRSAAVSGVTEPRGLLFSASEMRASVFAKWVRALVVLLSRRVNLEHL